MLTIIWQLLSLYMEKTAVTMAVNFYGWGQNDVKDTIFYAINKKWQNQQTLILPSVVRVKGLEPLRRKTPDPKSGASAIPPHSHIITIINISYFIILFKLV